MAAKTTDVDLPIVGFGDFRMDFNLRCLHRGSEKVKVGLMAFKALEFLVQNRHRVVSKDELLKDVWSEERTKGTVEHAISQLRRVLQDSSAEPRYIVTIPGHGYRFVAEVLIPNAWPSGADSPRPPEIEVAPPVSVRKPVWKLYAAVAVCAISLLALETSARHRSPSRVPSRVSFTEQAVVVLDAANQLLWKHDFHRRLYAWPAAGGSLTAVARIADLKGDGDQEVLVVAPFRKGVNPQDLFEIEIDCFSSQGILLWSYSPHETIRFGNDELRGPWMIWDVLVSHQGPKSSIWVAFNHYEWGNSFVEQIDPATGRGKLRYVNSGTTHTLNEMQTPRGTYLLAGGFNNEFDGGAVAVIDEAKSFAASPQTDGTAYKCGNCPSGLPDYYLVFPRSEINVIRKEYENPVHEISVNGDEFEVSKSEGRDYGSGERSIYLFRFRSTVQLVSRRYSSAYDMRHHEFERSGILSHSIKECPERLSPAPVKVWTPLSWQELKVPPPAH